MELQDRIRAALDHARIRQSELAARIGVSSGAASQWMTGKVKSLKADTAAKISAVTGVSAQWLVTGTGAMLPAEPTNVQPAQVGTRRVPLISYVQAGVWTEAADPYTCGDASDWLMTDLQLSHSSFALEIRGDSMLPQFKPGDRVIIDPSVYPQPGDFVVAKNGGDEATFKKYRPRSVDESGNVIFELVPLNEDYPTIRNDQTAIRIVGTMVEHRQYRKRW